MQLSNSSTKGRLSDRRLGSAEMFSLGAQLFQEHLSQRGGQSDRSVMTAAMSHNMALPGRLTASAGRPKDPAPLCRGHSS